MYLLFLLLIVPALSHLAFHETQRWRHDFFGLAGWNDPAPEDDWSFDHPFDLIQETSYVDRQTGQRVYRPDAACALESLLYKNDLSSFGGDVDVALYNKTADTPTVFFGYPQVPACGVYKDVYPTFALVGPLGTRDHNTGKLIFTTTKGLPFRLPQGYGAKVVVHPQGRFEHRGAYFESNTYNEWMYPQGWTKVCAEASNPEFPQCDLSNLLYVTISTPGNYYWAIWVGPITYIKPVDVGMVVGMTDVFVPDDFIRLGFLRDSTSRGITVHGICTSLPDGFLKFD